MSYSFDVRRTVTFMVILSAMVGQIYIAGADIIGPIRGDLNAINSSNLSSESRSARLAFGDEFSAYIQFLRRNIPEDKIAALPPEPGHVALGHTGLMQYFLFPRRTTNCPLDLSPRDCLAQIEGPDVYVLQVGGFPDSTIEAGLNKEYVPFSETWGLFVPSTDDAER